MVNKILENVCLYNFKEHEEKNKNGHKYNKQEVIDQFFKFFDKGSPILGELNHYNTNLDLVNLNIKNLSHAIFNIHKMDDGIYGDVEILYTDNGKIVLSLIENDIPIIFGLRGTGVVDPDGNITNFDLIAVDIINEKA